MGKHGDSSQEKTGCIIAISIIMVESNDMSSPYFYDDNAPPILHTQEDSPFSLIEPTSIDFMIVQKQRKVAPKNIPLNIAFFYQVPVEA